jgi:hypothetical protein
MSVYLISILCFPTRAAIGLRLMLVFGLCFHRQQWPTGMVYKHVRKASLCTYKREEAPLLSSLPRKEVSLLKLQDEPSPSHRLHRFPRLRLLYLSRS